MNKDNLIVNAVKRSNNKGPYVTVSYEYDPGKKIILKLDGSAGKNKNIIMKLETEGNEVDFENIPFEKSISTIYKIHGCRITKTLPKISDTISAHIEDCFSGHIENREISFLCGQLVEILNRLYKNY